MNMEVTEALDRIMDRQVNSTVEADCQRTGLTLDELKEIGQRGLAVHKGNEELASLFTGAVLIGMELWKERWIEGACQGLRTLDEIIDPRD